MKSDWELRNLSSACDEYSTFELRLVELNQENEEKNERKSSAVRFSFQQVSVGFKRKGKQNVKINFEGTQEKLQLTESWKELESILRVFIVSNPLKSFSEHFLLTILLSL